MYQIIPRIDKTNKASLGRRHFFVSQKPLFIFIDGSKSEHYQ